MAYNRERWAVRLLNRLDIQPRRQNVKALVGWQRAEGGHTNGARFNPLNTTQPMPGAGNTGTQGNIKVYRNRRQGLRATVKTLRNGRYDNILGALREGSAQDVASAIGSTPWGTSGDLVSRTVADTHVGRVPSIAPSKARASRSTTRMTTRTVTTPGVDNSEQRRALLINYLGERGKPGALLSLATQLRQYPDIPGTKTITATETTVPQGNLKTAPDGDPYVAKVTRRANRIDSKRLPYLYGGGHQVRRVKIKDTGPLDCSSAVSAALGVDVRVSGQFQTFGKPGRAPGGKGITIYANPEHVLMEINGRFWGTSGSNPQGGAGWIPRSAISKDYLKRFTARHV